MSHARARRAIEVKLDAWAEAEGLMVAHGAEPFDPPEGQVYLRAFLIPASTTCRYLNASELEYSGIYQVSIITPIDQLISVPEQIIDQLSALFPLDSLLDRAGFLGQVSAPVEQGPTITEPDRYTVPASFTYRGSAAP
ncbi:Bacteriophage related protein of unknown function [Pseudomonas mohnii]|uniref:DUF4128 domain-containing protein n=1 Tax=Pseudomonas mohnii TaxID=395600 RepID=A0ABY0YCD7_9PSED|nr:phage tail terminator-like protein [Pseudomonas mohnii]SED33046.1 Bacteriophage related protein of unknown function [Pseudomonas mohnii]